MTAELSGGSALIGIPDIAEIAGVSRPAVSNWRKRHATFPTPVVMSPSGAMFDMDEVEEWLIENGKIDAPFAASVKLWAVADRALAQWRPDELMRFLLSGLVYLDVRRNGTDFFPEEATWQVLDGAANEEFVTTLRTAYAALEARRTSLTGLLLPGIRGLHPDQGEWAKTTLRLLALCADDIGAGYVEIFDDVITRLVERDRFAGARSTPDELCQLIGLLAGEGRWEWPSPTIVDLAVGEAGLLSWVASFTAPSTPDEQAIDVTDLNLHGVEIDENVLQMARTRLLLTMLTRGKLHHANSLTLHPDELPLGDIVLADPPWGVKGWGDAETYLSDRWPFGTPRADPADLAWVQRVIMQLAPTGTGFVLTPPSALFGLRERTVRLAMVDAGAIEAIIELPTRLRTETGIAPVLWVVRPPRDAPTSILMIDGSGEGDPGRERTKLSGDFMVRAKDALARWRADGTIAEADADMVWSADPERIHSQEGELSIARYRPARTVDITPLVRRRNQLRELLGSALPADAAPLVPPRSAELVALGDLLDVYRPRSFKAVDADSATDKTTARVLDGKEIRGDAARVVDLADVPHPVIAEIDDIVLSVIGVPESMVVAEDWAGAVVGQNSVLLRVVNEGRVLPGWIDIWLRSASYREQLARHQAGSVVPRLSIQALREMEVPVPSLQDQERQVSSARAMRAAIDERRVELRRLEALLHVSADLATSTGGDR